MAVKTLEWITIKIRKDMKIPFDIKFRPQIESGEYKVETECGHPVSIMDWEWTDRNEKKCLAVKVLMDEGFNIGYLFDYDGKRHSIFPSDSDSDLFIITPEPELNEFEKHLKQLLDFSVTLGSPYEIDCIKSEAAELLELARKELEPEVLERLELAYKNQDEVVYENGKRDGKAEALKDLPRWKKAKEYIKLELDDYCFTLDNDGKMGPYWATEIEKGQYFITESDIEKLPKEEE